MRIAGSSLTLRAKTAAQRRAPCDLPRDLDLELGPDARMLSRNVAESEIAPGQAADSGPLVTRPVLLAIR